MNSKQFDEMVATLLSAAHAPEAIPASWTQILGLTMARLMQSICVGPLLWFRVCCAQFPSPVPIFEGNTAKPPVACFI